MTTPEGASSFATEGALQFLRKDLLLLEAQRSALELEADAIASELNSPGPNGEDPVGIRGALTDSDGFPLAGFDLFNIREKRHRFNCIQTDHKIIMSKIEKALHALHEAQAARLPAPPSDLSAKAPSRTSTGQASAGLEAPTPSAKPMVAPIAKVNQVAEGSPAATAGLEVGDLVLRLGNVDISHPKGLAGVVDLVRQREGQEVPVTVLRREGKDVDEANTKDLTLVPRTWSGRGLLGVHLLPP